MGKNLGEDLVFGSRAPGGQQSQKMGSRNMEIQLTATPCPLPDIPNHSEIILPVFYQIFHPGRSVAILLCWNKSFSQGSRILEAVYEGEGGVGGYEVVVQ